MELTDLRYFLNAATAGTFVAGARRSHVSPPAMTKTIRKLEEELDTALFVRTTRRVALTEAGELLLLHCRRVFGVLDEFQLQMEESRGSIGGELRIGAMEVFSIYLLPAALTRLVSTYDRLSPRCHELVPERMESLIADGRLDLGFTIGGGGHPKLAYHPLGKSPGALVCGRAHPLYRRGRVTSADLQRYAHAVPRFLDLEHLPPLDQFPEAEHPRRIGATFELLQMGIELAVQGGFLAYFPEISVRPQLASRQLKRLSGVRLGQAFELRAVVRKGIAPRPGAQKLIAEVRRLLVV